MLAWSRLLLMCSRERSRILRLPVKVRTLNAESLLLDARIDCSGRESTARQVVVGQLCAVDVPGLAADACAGSVDIADRLLRSSLCREDGKADVMVAE